MRCRRTPDMDLFHAQNAGTHRYTMNSGWPVFALFGIIYATSYENPDTGCPLTVSSSTASGLSLSRETSIPLSWNRGRGIQGEFWKKFVSIVLEVYLLSPYIHRIRILVVPVPSKSPIPMPCMSIFPDDLEQLMPGEVKLHDLWGICWRIIAEVSGQYGCFGQQEVECSVEFIRLCIRRAQRRTSGRKLGAHLIRRGVPVSL